MPQQLLIQTSGQDGHSLEINGRRVADNHEQIVVDKLDEFRAWSRGRMELTVIDPTGNPEAEEVAKRLGVAPVQGHISGVVDIPNACATLWLPTDIFEFDINPTSAGPVKYLDGSVDMPISPDK